MAIKIYKPTDSLQVYTEINGSDPVLVTATHLRISVNVDKVSITDVLVNKTIVPETLATSIVDANGASIGATFIDALLYLAKIIG